LIANAHSAVSRHHRQVGRVGPLPNPVVAKKASKAASRVAALSSCAHRCGAALMVMRRGHILVASMSEYQYRLAGSNTARRCAPIRSDKYGRPKRR
jgi:hypothetical protein